MSVDVDAGDVSAYQEREKGFDIRAVSDEVYLTNPGLHSEVGTLTTRPDFLNGPAMCGDSVKTDALVVGLWEVL